MTLTRRGERVLSWAGLLAWAGFCGLVTVVVLRWFGLT